MRTYGTFNSAVGWSALLSNTTGHDNAALGQSALYASTTGSGNTAVGENAGLHLGTGCCNLLLGLAAGLNYTGAETSNIAVGNSGTVGESNTIRIGDNLQSRAFLAGVRGVTTGLNDAIPVVVDSSGQLGTTSSSRRFKTDIQPLRSGTDRLMALQPVSFHYKQYARGPNDRIEYGLIAEDVARVYPELVVNGPDGKPLTVMYQELPALLLAQAQRQHAQIQHQQRQIAALQAQNRRLRHQQAQIDWLMHHARLR